MLCGGNTPSGLNWRATCVTGKFRRGGAAINSAGLSTPMGYGSSCDSTNLFVVVVQIEEDLAHIAAMASMASSYLVCGDRRGHFRAQVDDELFDERRARGERDKGWEADWERAR